MWILLYESSLYDSRLAFQACKYIHIIEEIKELVSRNWRVLFTHSYRESGQCVDFMAKCGANDIIYPFQKVVCLIVVGSKSKFSFHKF
jgi:hypothetical protein